MMFFWGILSGCAATVFQDAGYIFSRLYVKHGVVPSRLLFNTQIVMGLAMLPLIVWACGLLQWHILWPLLGSAYGSLFGQLFMFKAELKLDPPKISSMMGLRVVLIFLISAVFFGEHYNLWQVGAIVLAACSAFVLNWQNGKLQFGGMRMLGLSLFSYAFSDISVMRLVHGMNVQGIFFQVVAAMTLVNVLLALSTAWTARRMRPREITRTLPFSMFWLVKQFFLYICYGLIGPVFGNVIMSMRGPVSLILTSLMARRHPELEDPADAGARVRRMIAIGMMTLAIIIYSLA